MMLIAFMILYELKVFKFLKQKVTYNVLIKVFVIPYLLYLLYPDLKLTHTVDKCNVMH